jgi:hypothetical protein
MSSKASKNLLLSASFSTDSESISTLKFCLALAADYPGMVSVGTLSFTIPHKPLFVLFVAEMPARLPAALCVGEAKLMEARVAVNVAADGGQYIALKVSSAFVVALSFKLVLST